MAQIYDTDQFAELYSISRRPTADHLFLAAKHLRDICHQAGIPYAFMGSWTVRLRGGTRETHDVDISVSTTMEHFKNVVLQQPRNFFPKVHGEAAVNIFVHTGMSYDLGYQGLSNLAVQVDVIIGGQLNSPGIIDNNTSETLTMSNGFTAIVIKTGYLFRGKFETFMRRGHENNNDYHDLVFLIFRYPEDVVNSGIGKDYRQAFFRRYVEMNLASVENINWMKQTLGLEEEADWVWDTTYQKYRRFVNGNWEWANT